jgi:nicotinamidase-related amidase
MLNTGLGAGGSWTSSSLSPGDGVIRKTRYDSFYGTFLENLLGFYGIKHLVVTSTAVNICVLHTAGSAALR